MSANSSSAVNALSNSSSAATTTPPLLRLPPELIEMVAQAVKKPADLLSFRLTCRDLRDGSAMAFCRRFFNRVQVNISGSSSSFQELTDTLLSTALPPAQHFATILAIRTPFINPGWGIEAAEIHKRLAPSPADVTRLLAAMPNLVEVDIMQFILFDTKPMVQAAPALLRGLATPGAHLPRLRRLTLTDMHMETGLLLDVLETHKHSLDFVFLSGVTLTGGSSGMYCWLDIFKAIHSTDVSSVKIYFMQFDGDLVGFPEEIQTKPDLMPYENGVGESFVNSEHAKSTLEIVLRVFGRAV